MARNEQILAVHIGLFNSQIIHFIWNGSIHWDKNIIQIRLAPKALVDFHEGCVFNQVAKESSFTHTDIVTCATPTGRITLSDQTVTVTENNSQTKNNTFNRRKSTLVKKHFWYSSLKKLTLNKKLTNQCQPFRSNFLVLSILYSFYNNPDLAL